MTEFQYIPAAQTNKAKRIATGVFAASLVVFALSSWKGIPFRFAFQLVSCAMMTVAILVCVRYLFKSYGYRIEPSEQGYDFVVLEITRHGSCAVCRLGMEALLSVEPWTPELAKQKKAQKSLKIYNYCVDIAPSNAYLLSFSDSIYATDENPICLKLQCDDAFKSALLSFLQNS